MIGIILLALTLFFFSLAFLFYLITVKKNISGKLDSFFLFTPILLNIITYGYFAYLFLSHQFQFDYVYQYSNLSMPRILLFSSSWAGQAGSLLLWSFFCCIGLFIANRDREWKKLVIPILLIHQIAILLLIWNAKPFAGSVMLFKDGLGMTPALSHVLMVIHPPFAFLGYAFLALSYAYCIASLLNGKFDQWLIKAKKYALLALTALSITTILGSLWAYQVIGWGGYWSFDPIENGTLITCLLLLAFIHAQSLFQKQKWGLRFLHFLSILIYSSVIHMILLIRSGLLKNLTQHSYSGSGLLYALLLADIITFFIPVFLFIQKAKNMESRSLKISLFSKSGRNRAVIWLLLLMSAILFIDLNQPLLAKPLSLSPTQFSPELQWLFFIVTLVTFLFLVLSSSSFAHNRSIRIHTWGRNLFQLLLSFLIVLLVLISLGAGLSTKTFLLLLFFLIPVMGALKAAMNMTKLKWYAISKELSHIAICLVLISIFATNVSNKEERVCLEKNVPFTNKEYTIILQNSIQTIPQYIGEKEQYALDFSRGPFRFTAFPSQWRYQRNKGLETQKNPFVKILPNADIIIIPQHKGLKTLQLDKETNLKGLIVTLKDYSKTTSAQGINIEKATINFQKEIDKIGSEPLLLQEDYSLSRRTTKQGLLMEKSLINPTILGEEMEWISTENDHSILISSLSISRMYEFDIYIKPFMLLLRISYFLLIFSLLWMVIMNQWEKKLLDKHKHGRRKKFVTRPHHTHHHQ